MALPRLKPNTDLAGAVADAEHRFIAANPKSKARIDSAKASMPGGNTRTVLHYSPFPVAFKGGEGCRLTDIDGHTYVDFLGEYTAGLYGHSNPRIMTALRQVIDGGVTLGGPNVFEAELARMMCERFPSVELIRFCNSGTEANLFAMVTARDVHEAQPHHGDERRLSRRRILFRPAQAADQRAVPVGDRALQRHRGHDRADRGACTRAGGDRGRADDGRRRCDRGRQGVPAGAPRCRQPPRHRAGLRRGDDLAAIVGRTAEAARHHPGHDHVRQVSRWRHELRRLRRPSRHHGPLRSLSVGFARRMPAPSTTTCCRWRRASSA